MFHIKAETLSVPSYMSYISSMPSTSKLFETQQKEIFYSKYCKYDMEKSLGKLRLDAQDEHYTFEIGESLRKLRLVAQDDNTFEIGESLGKLCLGAQDEYDNTFEMEESLVKLRLAAQDDNTFEMGESLRKLRLVAQDDNTFEIGESLGKLCLGAQEDNTFETGESLGKLCLGAQDDNTFEIGESLGKLRLDAQYEYYDNTFEMEESLVKLRLNTKVDNTFEMGVVKLRLDAQDDTKAFDAFKDSEQQGVNCKGLCTKTTSPSLHFEDESRKIILECKECSRTFRFSIKSRFHANQNYHYEWLCLNCCQSDNYMPKTRDTQCPLCSKKFYGKAGFIEHFRAKHPNAEIQPKILSIVSRRFLKGFVHECIPYQFPSQFPLFPSYRLKCKICELIFYTHAQFNNHARLHGYYFLCEICSKLFPKKAGQKKHIVEEHKDCDYQYNTCKTKFNTYKLSNHYRTKLCIQQFPQSRELIQQFPQFPQSSEPIKKKRKHKHDKNDKEKSRKRSKKRVVN